MVENESGTIGVLVGARVGIEYDEEGRGCIDDTETCDDLWRAGDDHTCRGLALLCDFCGPTTDEYGCQYQAAFEVSTTGSAQIRTLEGASGSRSLPDRSWKRLASVSGRKQAPCVSHRPPDGTRSTTTSRA